LLIRPERLAGSDQQQGGSHLPAQTHEEADRFMALGRLQLTFLVALIALTVGAWALTLYYALEMGAPMDIAVRDGLASAFDP
jgi:predicted metal-binding membrane protein